MRSKKDCQHEAAGQVKGTRKKKNRKMLSSSSLTAWLHSLHLLGQERRSTGGLPAPTGPSKFGPSHEHKLDTNKKIYHEMRRAEMDEGASQTLNLNPLLYGDCQKTRRGRSPLPVANGPGEAPTQAAYESIEAGQAGASPTVHFQRLRRHTLHLEVAADLDVCKYL